MDAKLVERFEQKFVKDESGCWLWTAALAGKGYGQIKLPGERKQIYAHRLSYMIYKDENLGDLHVCHTCDNPRCVNPDHLFLGTAKDNHQDKKKKGRSTHGVKSKVAKLSENDVRQIRAMLAAKVPQTKIAAIYNISQIEVSRINTRQRWDNLI